MSARRVIDALRSGVPNRMAVATLGCNQSHITNRFEQCLQHLVLPGASEERHGFLIEGGFGSGKSHILKWLEHYALSQNFACRLGGKQQRECAQ